jgi:hypothetical protein
MKLDVNPSTEHVDPIAVSSNPHPVSEKLVFLCGQCSDGFASLEACKQHMMQVMHSDMELLYRSLSSYVASAVMALQVWKHASNT